METSRRIENARGQTRSDEGGPTWVAIDGVVYDIARFIDVHPGGPQVLKDNLGKDISSIFHLLHSPETLRSASPYLDKLGELSATPTIEVATSDEDEVQKRRRDLPDISYVANLATFERLAKDVLGENSRAWEFISSYAEDGATLASNRNSFSYLRFLPRINVPVAAITTATTFLGKAVPAPIFMAPTGGSANAHPDGELNVTRAAAETGIPQAVSSMSSVSFSSLSDRRDSLLSSGYARAPLWWQLYIMNDRAESERRIRQAVADGAEAILITVDVATPGNREVAGKAFKGHGAKAGSGPATKAISPDLFTADLSWRDIAWVKEIAPAVPILLKGVATVQDVALAKQYKADGVILSNHGGRQLDHAPPPLATLVQVRQQRPELLDDPNFEVYIDGGVWRGTDVLKALCVGARGVGLGRPILYAQATYGPQGVTRALEIVTAEIEIGMRLLGARSISELRPEMVELLNGGLVGTPLG
ncbi:hypothetical protein IAT38_008361 [Cryptococcus sp. DSM 104549]